MTEPRAIDQERKAKIDALLAEPILARIATLSTKNLQPHVVPVWYLWDGESIWISAYRSTRKIRELQQHTRCSIVVDETTSSSGLTGAILEGEAELVTEPIDFVRRQTTEIYTRYLGPDGVLAADPQEWIHSPENLLVKLTPQQIYSW